MSRLWLPDQHWRIEDPSTRLCFGNYNAVVVGSNGKRFDESYVVGTWSLKIKKAKINVSSGGLATYTIENISPNDMTFTLDTASVIGARLKQGYQLYKSEGAPAMENGLRDELGVTVYDKLGPIKEKIKNQVYNTLITKSRIAVIWDQVEKVMGAQLYKDPNMTQVGNNTVQEYTLTGKVTIRPLFMSSSRQSDNFTIIQTGSGEEEKEKKCLPAAIYFNGDFSEINEEATDQDSSATDKKNDIRFRIDNPVTEALINDSLNDYLDNSLYSNQDIIDIQGSPEYEGAFAAARMAAEQERNQRIQTTEEFASGFMVRDARDRERAERTAREIWRNWNTISAPDNDSSGFVWGLSSTTPGVIYAGIIFHMGPGGLKLHQVGVFFNPNNAAAEYNYWQQRAARVREYNENVARQIAAARKAYLDKLAELEKLNTVTFSTDLSLADSLTQLVLQGRDLGEFKSIFDNAAGASGSTVFNYFNGQFYYDAPSGLYWQFIPIADMPNVYTAQFLFGW